MITNKQKKLNEFVIKEAGLELDQNDHVVDQDTGMPIIIKEKKVKYNNGSIFRLTSNEIEFDPLNNPLLANEICGNYINKLHNEGELETVAYGITNKERNTSGYARCIKGIGDSNISSKEYVLDSLKYIDLIASINNTSTDSKESINLKSYDQKEKKTTRRRR